MAVKEIGVTEAHRLLQQGEGCIYLDVRSVPEYQNGHPEGAVNVPLLDVDPVQQRMLPNQDFLVVVSAAFPKESRLLVGCQMGGRSAKAAEVLAEAGYTDVTNVKGGFGGVYDRATGLVVEPGWLPSGLPVEQGNPQGRAYADLKKK